MTLHSRHVRNGSCVLRRRTHRGFNWHAVPPQHLRLGVLKRLPWKALKGGLNIGRGCSIRLAPDVIAGVDRVQSETRCGANVDIRFVLDVVGVGSKSVPPAFGEDPPGCIVDDLRRRSPRPRHLAHRLLREDRYDGLTRSPDGPNVPAGSKAEPIAKPHREVVSDKSRPQPGQRSSQPLQVGVAGRPNHHLVAVAGSSLSFYGGEIVTPRDESIVLGEHHGRSTYLDSRLMTQWKGTVQSRVAKHADCLAAR